MMHIDLWMLSPYGQINDRMIGFLCDLIAEVVIEIIDLIDLIVIEIVLI